MLHFFNEKAKIKKIKKSEKTACQKGVSMVTSNLTDKYLLSQIVAR